MKTMPTIRGGTYYGTRRELARILPEIYRGLFEEDRAEVKIDGFRFDCEMYVALVNFAVELEELRAAADDG